MTMMLSGIPQQMFRNLRYYGCHRSSSSLSLMRSSSSSSSRCAVVASGVVAFRAAAAATFTTATTTTTTTRSTTDARPLFVSSTRCFSSSLLWSDSRRTRYSSDSSSTSSIIHCSTQRRYFSASATNADDTNLIAKKACEKLVLGSHKWSKMDPSHYTEIVQTALANGITTIEAGQEGQAGAQGGPLQALYDCLSQIKQQQDDAAAISIHQPVQILQRIGYRTELRLPPPPVAKKDNIENDEEEDHDENNKQEPTTPASPSEEEEEEAEEIIEFSLLAGDVIVEEVPASAMDDAAVAAAPPSAGAPKEKQPPPPKLPPGATTVVLHNIGAAGIPRAISESPFVKSPLTLGDNDKVETILMLHNPEVQGGPAVDDEKGGSSGLILPGGGGSSSKANSQARQEAICTQLVESFMALEKAVAAGQIASYGIVSNGLGLPFDHPLHLSWDLAIRPALQQAFEQLDHRPLHFRVLELPVNLIETTGLKVARQVRRDVQQDGEFQQIFATSTDETSSSLSSSCPLQVYAMRPLSAYPDLGTGQDGHSLILADYLLPTLTSMEGVTGMTPPGDSNDASSTGEPASSMQWSHTMSSPPEIYNVALKTAMQHFDAEAILEAQQERLSQGETADLTVQERETLDGCKLMQSLLHDVDIGLSKMRSFAVHERELMQRIIPLIYDTFEEYDDDTAVVLQTFFAAYSLAVRYAIAKNTRRLLLHGEETDAVGTSNIPTFDDLHPDMKLQEYALGFILKQQIQAQKQQDQETSQEEKQQQLEASCSKDVIDKIIVGCTDPDQVIDDLELIYQFYARKLLQRQQEDEADANAGDKE